MIHAIDSDNPGHNGLVVVDDSLDVSVGRLALLIDQSHGLWWVDVSSGQRSFIATASAPVRAIARTREGTVYAVGKDLLYRLNPASGECVAVAPLHGSSDAVLTGLTAADDGSLYAVDSQGNLHAIDVRTGATRRLVALDAGLSGNGDVVAIGGAVYWTSVWGELHRYEPASGSHRVVLDNLPTLNGTASITSLMAFDSHEIMAVDSGTHAILRIDLRTNTVEVADVRLMADRHAADALVDGTQVPASGNIWANDPQASEGVAKQVLEVTANQGDWHVAGSPIAGKYGVLRLQPDGTYSYLPFATLPEGLRSPGDTLQDLFTYTAIDANGQTAQATLTINLHGHTDAPMVAPTQATAVEAGGWRNSIPGLDPVGNLLQDATDPAQPDQAPRITRLVHEGRSYGPGQTVAMRYGQLVVFENGDYRYTVNQSHREVERLRHSQDRLTEVVSVEVTGATGLVRVSTLTLSIEGRDDAPDPVSRTVFATPAHGIHQATPGHNPSGSLIQASTDVDNTPQQLRITAVRAPAQQAGDPLVLPADSHTVAIGGTTFGIAVPLFPWAGPGTQVANNGLADPHDTSGDGFPFPQLPILAQAVEVPRRGHHGTLLVQADGSYHYEVDASDPLVQALRTPQDQLQDVFGFDVTDGDGLVGSATLTVVIEGANDAPTGISVGRRFDGDGDSVLSAAPLPASANFGIDLVVSPGEAITLPAVGLDGTEALRGQHYAWAPMPGGVIGGAADHAGLGLSVGVNGIVVVRASAGVFSPLLSWSGQVGPNTHVAVDIVDNRPILYVNRERVAEGLASDMPLHPPTEAGGIEGAYFTGALQDLRVWDAPALWQAANLPDMHPVLTLLALELPENTAAGKRLTTVRAHDVDTGDLFTYSLSDDAGGLFRIDANSGDIRVTPGARLDHERQPVVTLTARATDAGGLSVEHSFTVRITDVNEPPTSSGGEARMNEDNQIRLDLTRVEDLTVDGQAMPAVRVDSLPAGGELTLDGQPVARGQVMAATDAVRMVFRPGLFNPAAFRMHDVDAGDHISAVRFERLPDPAHGRLMLDGEPLSQETIVVLARDLDRLRFEPAQDFNGHTTFTYRVIDSWGVQQTGDASTFTLHIQPVNDVPVIQPTWVIDVQEGVATPLAGLGFSDVDASEDAFMTVTLRVDEGVLMADATPAVGIEGSGTQTLVLSGTRAALQQLIAQSRGVSYRSEPHEPPPMTGDIERLDPEGVEDPRVRVSFTTEGGRFSANAAQGIELSGNHTASLQIVGRASEIGPYITNGGVVREVPIPMAHLTMTVNDGGHEGLDPGLTGGDTDEQDVRTIALSVVPRGLPLNPPLIASEGLGHAAGPQGDGAASAVAMGAVAVGTPLVLALGVFDRIAPLTSTASVEEAAANLAWTAAELRETLHIFKGDLRHRWLEFVKWVAPPPSVPPGSPLPPLVPPPPLPILLPAVGVKLLVDLVGIIKAASNQQGGTPEHPRNQPPQVTGPDRIDGLENQALAVRGLHFSDPDAGDGTVSVTFQLSSDDAVLSALPSPGVQVLGHLTNTLVLLGTVTAIDAFVSATSPGVQVVPDENFNGRIDLTVTINDLGNTGEDAGSEEARLVVPLQIAPVSDAPEGRDSAVAMVWNTSYVLSPGHFGFTDVDGDAFVAVRITELPASGRLLLQGVPVVADQWIARDALDQGHLVYEADPALTGPPVHPRIGFRVIDAGSTERDGQTQDTTTHHLSLQVQYPPALSLGTTSVVWHEADREPVAWLGEVSLHDRSSEEASFRAIEVRAHDLAFGDRWFIDHERLSEDLWRRIRIEDLGEGLSRIHLDGADAAQVQAILQALGFVGEGPNATEGTRRFQVTVIDTDDLASEPLAAEIGVTSILGDLTRAVEAARSAVVAQHNAAPQTQSASPQALLSSSVFVLLQAKAALAQAVAQSLAEAKPDEDGRWLMGTTLDAALRALGLGGPGSRSLIETPASGRDRADWPADLTILVREPAREVLTLSSEQRATLLAWAEREHAQAEQWASWQAALASHQAQDAGNGDEPALRALRALDAAQAAGNHWIVDTRLPTWLASAGLQVRLVDAGVEDTQAWLREPDALVRTTDALHLSPPLLAALRQQLLQALDTANNPQAPARQLLDALEAVEDEDAPTLPTEARAWLDALGLGIRWVDRLTPDARPGEAAQAADGTHLVLTAATRESLTARLLAREAARVDVPPEAGPTGLSGVELLQIRHDLDQASSSLLADRVWVVPASAALLNWLNAGGHAVLNLDDYQAPGMNDALARQLARPDVALMNPATGALHLGDRLFQQLDVITDTALAQRLQIALPSAADSTPPVDPPETGASPMDRLNSEPLHWQSAWQRSVDALKALLGADADARLVVQQPVPGPVQVFESSLSNDPLHRLASAGVVVRDLGPWDALGPAEREALADPRHPALARDALGQAFMDTGVLQQLQARLVAQAGAERAEFARALIGEWVAAPAADTLPLVSDSGQVQSGTSRPFGGDATPLVRMQVGDLARLRTLGIGPIEAVVVDGFLSPDQARSLVAGTHPVAIDRRSGTVWVHDDIRREWLSDLADRLLDGRSADPARGGAFDEALHARLTGDQAMAWVLSPVGGGLVRISLDVATLLSAQLAFRALPGDSDDPVTRSALLQSATGTVLVDAKHPHSLLMSEATWAALLQQDERIIASIRAAGEAQAGEGQVSLLQALRNLEHMDAALPDPATDRVWLDHGTADLLDTLRALGLTLVDPGQEPTAQPPGSGLDTPNSFAVIEGRLVVSQATWADWREALSAHASALGAPADGPAPWEHTLPVQSHAPQTLGSEAMHRVVRLDTQLSALLWDARSEALDAADPGVRIWRVQAMPARLDADVLRVLLQEPDLAFDWTTLPAGEPGARAGLLNTTYPTVGQSPDGALYLSPGSYEHAATRLQALLDDARVSLARQLQQQLMQAQSQDGWYLLPPGTLPADVQALLPLTALRSVAGQRPGPGEIGTDGDGALWLHGLTRLQLLHDIGAAVPAEAPHGARDLLGYLDAARIASTAFGIYSIDGKAAPLLEAWQLGQPLAGLYGGGLLGIQNLGEAGHGHYQAGADGRLFLDADTLAALRASVGGRVNAEPPSGEGELTRAAALLRFLDDVQGRALASPLDPPAATDPIGVASPAWPYALRDWIVMPGPGTPDELAARAGLAGDWLSELGRWAPVRLLVPGDDAALLAALQQGELQRDGVIVQDAHGNRWMSPATHGYLQAWIASGLAASHGLDVSAWPGPASDEQRDDARRALHDQNATDPWVQAALHASTGELLMALMSAQAVGTDRLRVDLTADRLLDWLQQSRGLVPHRLTLVPAGSTDALSDGSYAVVDGQVELTRNSLQQLIDIGLGLSQALVKDQTSQLAQELVYGNGSRTEQGHVVIADSPAFEVWRSIANNFKLAAARDMAGTWHEAPAEHLKAAIDAWTHALLENSTAQYLAGTTQVTMADGSSVELRNDDLIDAARRVNSEEGWFARDAQGNWVSGIHSTEWLATEALARGLIARELSADTLSALLLPAIDAAGEQNVLSLPFNTLMPLLDRLDLPVLPSTDMQDLGLSLRLIDTGDGLLHLSTDTARQWLAMVEAGQTVAGHLQQLLAVFNEADTIDSTAGFIAGMATTDLLPAQARQSAEPAGKLLIGVALDPGLWQQLGQPAAGSGGLPIAGPLAQATAADWNALWDRGSVRVFTNAAGEYRYVMTVETWNALLADADAAHTASGTAAIVRLDAQAPAEMPGPRPDALSVVAHDELPTRWQGAFADFGSMSAALAQLPTGTALRAPDGALWISSATADTALDLLKARLTAAVAAATPLDDTAGAVLQPMVEALEAARLAIAAAAAPQPAGDDGWQGHVIEAQALTRMIEHLNIPLHPLGDTDPSGLEAADPLAYITDAQGRHWISERGFAQLQSIVDTLGHGLDARVLTDRWQALPGQAIRVLDDSHGMFERLLQITQLDQAFHARDEALPADLADLGLYEYVRDASGRVYVNAASHQAIVDAADPLALAARAAFQEAVQGHLMAATADQPAALVFVAADSALYGRIVNSSVATQLPGSRDQLALDAAARATLCAPDQYRYALSDGGLLIGQQQLEALSRRADSGIGLLEPSHMEVIAPIGVVSGGHPMLAEWLAQLGYRTGSLLDHEGRPLPPDAIDLSRLTDAQRAQLQGQTGLIVVGTQGQLLMSESTWAQLAGRSLLETTAVQAALADKVQRGLAEASPLAIDGLPEGAVVTLPGMGHVWLAVFEALGMGTRLLGTAGGPDDPQALLAPGGGMAVSLGAQGQLITSRANLERLLEWAQIGAHLFDQTDARLDAGRSFADVPVVALSTPDPGLPTGSLLSDWIGGTQGVRSAYTVMTTVRALMNSDMTGNGIISDKINEIYARLRTIALDDASHIDQIALHTPRGRDMVFDLSDSPLKDLKETIRSINEDAEVQADFLMPMPRTDQDYELLARVRDAVFTRDDLGRLRAGIDNQLNTLRNWDPAALVADPADTRTTLDKISRVTQKLDALVNNYRDQNLQLYGQRLQQLKQDHGDEAVQYAEAYLGGSATFADNILGGLSDLQGRLDQTGHDLQAPALRGLIRALEDRLEGTKELFSETLENELSTGVLMRVGERALGTYFDEAFKNTQEFKDAEAIGAASHAFQAARLIPSVATFATHIPAAIADAVNSYRIAGVVYQGTPEGRQLARHWTSQAELALLEIVGPTFSALQVPAWWYTRKPADRAVYWDAIFSAGTYRASGLVIAPGAGRLPLYEKYKQVAIGIAGSDKLGNSELSQLSNWLPNVSYQWANWAWAGTSLYAAWLWSQQSSPYARYMTVRSAVTALSGMLLVHGDAGGSGGPAWVWRHLHPGSSDEEYANWLYATGSHGGRLVASGMGMGSLALSFTDLIVLASLYGTQDENGSSPKIGWGQVVDAAWTVGATVFTIATLQLGWPAMLSLLPHYLRPDFSAIEQAIKLYAAFDVASDQGRSVEAAILQRQFWMEVLKAIPLVNLTAGVVGFSESLYGALGARTTIAEFKTALEQRVQAGETAPADGQAPMSQQVIGQARQLGAQEHYIDVSTLVDDFGFAHNAQVRVMKAALVTEVIDGQLVDNPRLQFFDSDDQIAGVATGNNLLGRHVIEVAVPNTRGSLATYLIRPDTPLTLADIGLVVNGPLLLLNASASTPQARNQFLIFNPTVAVHGGQGQDLYLLNASLRPQLDDSGQTLIAGYIRDGIASPGQDIASWQLAPATDETGSTGHSIHMGTGAEGFSAYQGIAHFVGSTYDDVITRYGAPAPTHTLMRVEGGGGRDVFDLRSGDNDVTLGAGLVHFGLSGLAAAAGLNREPMVGQGPHTDPGAYEPLFQNHFDSDNLNAVRIRGADDGLVQVFGHAQSIEALFFDFADAGLVATFHTDHVSIGDTSWRERYEITLRGSPGQDDAAPAPLRAVADTAIDMLVGTWNADRITVGQGARLKEIHGGGGNDIIDVDVQGIGVQLDAGDSLVTLGAHTNGATLLLREGNEALIHTQAIDGAAGGEDDETVKVHIQGGWLRDTWVDAREATQALSVDVEAGRAAIVLGRSDAQVRIHQSATSVDIDGTAQADAGPLSLVLMDLDGFSIDDLITDDGQTGRFLHTNDTGRNIYSSNWINDAGHITTIRLQTEHLAGITLEAGNSNFQLASLVAGAWNEQPAGVP